MKVSKRILAYFGIFAVLTVNNSALAEASIPYEAMVQKIQQGAPGVFKNFYYAEFPFQAGHFRFQTEDGQELNLAQFQGKPLLMALWASWCAPCRKELPQLAILQQKIKGQNFTILPINIDNKPKALKTFLTKLQADNLPIYLDPNMAIFKEVRAKGLAFGVPVVLLFDKDLTLIASYNGIAPWGSEEALEFINLIIKAQS